MPKILIVADDLTGANDTGVMIAQQGLRTCTILNAENTGANTLPECDCISHSTDSRGISAAEAYQRVFHAARRFGSPDTVLYSKRIDTTLRGNLGAETDAMLDALPGEHLAIIVPAFPHAGRIYAGGHLLVHGVPLYRTAAANDPKTPVTTASALVVYQKQSKRKIAEIHLEEMRQGEAFITKKLQSLYESGVRGVIFDAVQDDDLLLIAQSAVKSRLPFIAVDPGIFTAHVVSLLYKKQKERKKKILFAVGSINDVAVRQTQKLIRRPDVCCVVLDTAKVLASAAGFEQEIRRATQEALLSGSSCDICCVCVSGVFPETRIDLNPYALQHNVSFDDISARLNRALAQVVRNILADDTAYEGLFACGGDVAVTVCNALEAYGVYPLDDVIPLAVYGRIAGGIRDGLHLITKGGMIGDDDTMLDCIAYLQNRFYSSGQE